jgi:hypothetical protein
MPANKPRGAFSASANEPTYPGPDTAFEYDTATIGDALGSTSDIGSIASQYPYFGGNTEARAAPHLIGSDGSDKHNLDARAVATGAQTYGLGFVRRSNAGSSDVFIGHGASSWYGYSSITASGSSLDIGGRSVSFDKSRRDDHR